MEGREEAQHWRSVVAAFDGYMQYHLSANNARRMAYLALPRDAREIFAAIGYEDKLDAVDEGIRRNAEFIDEMIRDPVFANMLESDTDGAHAHSHVHVHSHSHEHSHEHSHDHSHGQAHEHPHDPPPAPGDSAPPPAPSPPAPAPTPARPKPTQAQRDQSQDKVRSTLRSFVRDWSAAGAPERAATYGPVLDALERAFPRAADAAGAGAAGEGAVGRDGERDGVADRGARQSRGRVLVPGCGLGRLAMEIAALGFATQGNEFSAHMLIASNFVLNQTSAPETHAVFPYLHSFSNQPSTHDLLASVRVPDVAPPAILAPGADFSLVAGDFEDVYGAPDQQGQWDAVVTCFFIDTARNVLHYLRVIRGLLRPGGKWINIGPLLWHFENSPPAKGEGSLELSLDEVKELATMLGFELSDERTVETTYTGMPHSMLRHVYTAAFWVATRME